MKLLERTNYTKKRSKNKRYINNPTLLIIAFTSVFFPRIIEAAGAPSIINFVHFPIVILTTLVAILTTKTSNKQQIAIVWVLLSGILILFISLTASSLFNSAGLVNWLLDFLMLGEPFFILLAITCISMSAETIKKLQGWLLAFSLINLVIAFMQRFLLLVGVMQPPGTMTLEDAVQGVFFYSGAGNYVSSTISFIVAMYYFLNFKTASIWLRVSGLLLAVIQLVISDSKQVIIALLAAYILLCLTKFTDIKKLLTYLFSSLLMVFILFWCIENIEFFSAFQNWTNRLEIFGIDGEGTSVKLSSFPIVASYYKSPLNWLFGLGPGHTVSRLGGWIIPEKWDLLHPLGATIHPSSNAVWGKMFSSWVAVESTMFSPFFGWAGIWGDLGLFGLGSYLYLNFLVWRYICINEFSKFLLLNALIFGLIFSQMEEPGYTLTVAMIVGLEWQEKKILPQKIRK